MACSYCSFGMSFSISSWSFFGVDLGNPKEDLGVFSCFSGIAVGVVRVVAYKCKGI